MTSQQLNGAAPANANPAPQMAGEAALLSFWLGPVQSFIATAHTTRDLWTGSYLLSWLTLSAIEAVVADSLGGRDAILYPDIVNDRVLDLRTGNAPQAADGNDDSAEQLRACLPNVFLALVPAGDEGNAIAAKAKAAVSDEWRKIAADVRSHLQEKWRSIGEVWDAGWPEQISHFFDVRVVVLPPNGEGYQQRFDLLGKLLAAVKMGRQIPPPDLACDTRPKCSLLGSYAQMGPRASLRKLADWWSEARPAVGREIRQRERLCAVSLVKRFAWPACLQDKLNLKSKDQRFADTATVAARTWLDRHGIDPEAHAQWSGHWLHWSRQEPPNGEEDERRVPDELWGQITASRRQEGVPIYYAVLMMDGDHIGECVRAVAAGGPEPHREFSRALAEFARREVTKVVEPVGPGNTKGTARRRATLIYSGGDDVLALLPLDTVLDRAAELADTFVKTIVPALPAGAKPTMSAGVVVAHYKEDLRFVLDQARAAEKQAKEGGRDAMCLRILKRGGEHASAVCGWGQVDLLRKLVSQPLRTNSQTSDAWAHRLGEEAEVLGALGNEPRSVKSRIEYLLGHSEGLSGDYRKASIVFWERFSDPAEMRKRNRSFHDSLRQYVFLMRAASFLATGREASR